MEWVLYGVFQVQKIRHAGKQAGGSGIADGVIANGEACRHQMDTIIKM
jgi:hypothetical protein